MGDLEGTPAAVYHEVLEGVRGTGELDAVGSDVGGRVEAREILGFDAQLISPE